MTSETTIANATLPETTYASAKRHALRTLIHAHMELGKVRLSAMVVFTTALGYVVASAQMTDKPFDWMRLFWTCLGTFLAAIGASAFNQAIEARRDARMNRTRNRPLPTRILTRTYAATFGLIVSIGGVAILCPTSNGITAFLATLNVLIYVVIYTPLKPVTNINTLVGAIVGGIPPMLGWTAVTNSVDIGAWILGAILFVWQIPHFMALCWLYREDYARGGFRMVPLTDPAGQRTAMFALVYSLILVPLCFLLVIYGYATLTFAMVSLVLGAGMIGTAIRFAVDRTNRNARKLFFASIIYLPLLTIALMATARGPYDGMLRGPGGYSVPSQEKFIEPADLPETAEPSRQ